MRKFIIYVSLILAVLLNVTNISAASVSVSSSEYWDECNSCSSSQMKRKAKNAIPRESDKRFSVYITNSTDKTIKKYSVTTFNSEEKHLAGAFARSVQIEANIAADFEKLMNDLDLLKAGMDIPASVVNSAFDLIHNNYNRTQVSNYMNANFNVVQTLGAAASIPLLIFKKLGLNSVVPLSFADGSTAEFVLTGVSDDYISGIIFDLDFNPGSAFDAGGNSIPETQEQANNYEGTWNNTNDAYEMGYWINRWYYSNGGGWVCRTVAVKGHSYTTCSRP